ncbi:amidohydrolase [Anaerosacchariphilus polymeriproducens]|uniref:Amidohydrolase n=1 Tax=Anaerosacchariphilus polymeriproducens TaxID=1812858 RepID=A0A371ATT1_9FIRM|nr:amidohydrolase [Anaerosacchariphilus polymeriproducens]RDU22949.1 amidohydrolase [Anaerosacchariphilus polymeriproducens]
MNIRFYNARILTMEDYLSIIEGEVWIKGNTIVHVGKIDFEKTKNIGMTDWHREIDVKGNLLMPGFKNAHTHSGMTFLRSYADDLPLAEWLTKQIFPAEAKLSKNDIYEFTILAITEYLTSGITANFDMYLEPNAITQAAVDVGFRTVQCGSLNDFSQSIEQMEEYYLKLNECHELSSYILGFHAEYTTSRKRLEQVASLAEKYRAPVFTHNSETKEEVEGCMERYQKTPTKLFEELGIYEYGGGGFHCVYLNDEDIEIFKKRKLSVVTNSGSNTKLASGIAPIQKLINHHINVAIGTDGPASNNCLDMFREMFLTTGLAKIKEKDASVVDANQVLYMATVGGAKAMGLKDCDVLKAGKKADIIMIDLKQPNMQPLNNITKNIVYSGSKINVKMTMVNGKILYEDFKFNIGRNLDEIYEKVELLKSRII